MSNSKSPGFEPGKQSGTSIFKKGKSITYGIAQIKNGPNPEAAYAFLAFMLSGDKGLRVLKEMDQPPFEPARVPTVNMKASLPDSITGLVEVKN